MHTADRGQYKIIAYVLENALSYLVYFNGYVIAAYLLPYLDIFNAFVQTAYILTIG